MTIASAALACGAQLGWITPKQGNDARAFLKANLKASGGTRIDSQVDGERFRSKRSNISDARSYRLDLSEPKRQRAEAARLADGSYQARPGRPPTGAMMGARTIGTSMPRILQSVVLNIFLPKFEGSSACGLSRH